MDPGTFVYSVCHAEYKKIVSVAEKKHKKENFAPFLGRCVFRKLAYSEYVAFCNWMKAFAEVKN